MDKVVKGIKGFLGLKDGDAAGEANDSSHATPPLPGYPPWSAVASPPSRQHATPIDLTSAESPRQIYEGDLLPDSARPRLEQRPNAAKRRSVKEHTRRKLSDATPVPDPAEGYRGPRAMGKPGAGNSYKPINTLKGNAIADHNNPGHGRKHATTYGRHNRNTKSIGLQRHGGQQAYLERNPKHHKLSTSYSCSPSHTSPVKRRKTERPFTEPVNTVQIEDSEEDEIQQVASPSRQGSTPGARSTLSSRSPHSSGSKQSVTGLKPASQSTSEFANTANLLIPKRTRPRRKNTSENEESQRSFGVEVPFLGAGSLSGGQNLEMITNDVEHSKLPSVENLERGVNYKSRNRNQLHRPTERVTSGHFPLNKTHINESTAETYSRTASEFLDRSRSNKNLREHRPAGSHASGIKGDFTEGSEDELARPDASESRRKQSPYRTTQQGKIASQRNDSAPKCYQLNYARTFDLVPHRTGLLLRHTDNPKIFRITGADIDGNVKTLHQLNLISVTRALVDNTCRMRLTGPSSQGSIYWYDLEFKDVHDFEQFRDRCVFPELAESNQITKSLDYMIQIFDRPLERDNEIGKSSMVNAGPRIAQSQNGHQPQSKTLLLSALMDESRNIVSSAGSSRDDLRKAVASTRGQARPVRATRATAPIHDQDHLDTQKEVEKFSVKVGLGRPWPNQLDFNIQEGFLKRRRCTVNFDDLPKLDEEEFLNDSLVNFYLLYLYDELKVSIDRVYFFNTYFFESLTKNTKGRDAINYDAVKSWTRRDDVFSYDHIVVPINENFHWYLAIICNVSNIARKPAVGHVPEGSQDLDLTTNNPDALAATPGSKNDANAEPQGEINDATSVQEPLVNKESENDDENLFEEETKISLIDRDEENLKESQQLTSEQGRFKTQMVECATVTAASSSTQAEGSKRPPKKKSRHRLTALKKDTDRPVIMVLDSLGGIHSNATRALREWLQAEGLEKRRMIVEIDNKGHYPKSAQIPMQNNFSDCGLYILGYAKKFFADPDGFKKKLLRGEMSSDTDWPDMDASKMRSDIRNLVFRLYHAQKEAHKAKRAVKAKDATISPANAGFENTRPTAQQSDIVKTDASSISRTAADEEPLLVTAPSKPVTTPTVKSHSGPPFDPEVQTDKSQLHTAKDVEKDITAQVSSTAKSSPKATTKTAPAQPKQSSMKRASSPEVRVPTKSPHIDASYVRYDGVTDRSLRPSQRPTDLTSPLQNHGLRSTDDGKSRMSSAKKTQQYSPSRSSRERPVSSSPLQLRTRSGSHDDPITLDDSQDLDAPLQRHPRPKRKSSPEIVELDRSQEFNVAAARRVRPQAHSSAAGHNTGPRLNRRDDSIQYGVGYEWQEGRDVARALKDSLEDEQLKLRGQANGEPRVAGRPMEDVHNISGVHSPSSRTLQEAPDAEAMDIDNNDAVIPESPEQLRSSPGGNVEEMHWQSMW